MQRPVTDGCDSSERADGSAGDGRFSSLDAWRGLAALFVAALHLETLGWISQSPLVQNAARFVDFFFVLSGFVIAHAYRAKLEKGWVAPFMMRRVGRLWPLHVATLGALVAMALAGASINLAFPPFDYSQLPANLTLTHAWGFAEPLSWNGPSWSISTEMFAYLVFAFLAWAFRGLLLDLACAIVLLCCGTLLNWAVLPVLPVNLDLIARCLFGFMAGTLAARLWQLTRLRPSGEIPALLLTLAAVAFLPPALEWLTVPIFTWVVLVYASDRGAVSHLLHRPLPQLLGKISYSIYMIHYGIVIVIKTVLSLFSDLITRIDGVAVVTGPWWLDDGLTLAYLAVVVGVSCLTYQWIEKPGRRWFNQRAETVPAAW